MVRGFAKEKNSKNPRLLWKWVGGSRSHSEFCNFFGKSSQNSPKPVLISLSSIVKYHVYSVCTLLKLLVDLSLLSMSVMGFQKNVDGI